MESPTVNNIKDALPDAFRGCNTWLNWMTFDKKGGKDVKPYKSAIPKNGKYTVDPHKPSNWASLDDAITRANADEGVQVGISLTPDGLKINDSYLWCLDFDGFSAIEGDDDGALEFARKVLTYTEFSPSGTGFKMFFLSDKPPANTPKIHFTPSKFAPHYPDVKKYQDRAIEPFSRGRFLAVTGKNYFSDKLDLKIVSEKELDALLTELDQWAKREGGVGIGTTSTQTNGNKVNVNAAHTANGNTEYRKLTETSLKAVLARINHYDEQAWSDVCNALARAYGESGREYFIQWSEDGYGQGVYAGFSEIEVNSRFDRAFREVVGKTGYSCKHLCDLAGVAAVNQDWEVGIERDSGSLFATNETYSDPQYYSDHEQQLPLYDVDPEAITALNRFSFRTPSELASLPKMPWLVKNILPATGIAAIFGQSGSGKSFWALDLLAHLSLGRDFYNKKTTACPVVYVCLEGAGGVSNRMIAWSKHHNQKLPDTFRTVTDQLSLFNQDAKPFALAIKNQGLEAGVIVIDTLNQSAPTADENTSADMGRIIQNAMTLQRLTESLVILVHHSGKDTTKGMRGHSSLLAALDVAIEVKRTPAGREWALSKAKDADDTGKYSFRLESVPLGTDEDGDTVNSCVALPDIMRTFQLPPPKGKNQVTAIDAINAHTAQTGNSQISVTEANNIVKAALGGGAKHQASKAKDTIDSLVAGGWLSLENDTLELQ
jgi:hypothetical protein